MDNKYSQDLIKQFFPYGEGIKELLASCKNEDLGLVEDNDLISCRIVFFLADIQKINQVLDRLFGKPIKPAGSALTINLDIVDKIRGIRQDQTLYFGEFNAETSVYCAIWPWQSDPARFTLNLGIFFRKPLESYREKEELSKYFNGNFVKR